MIELSMNLDFFIPLNSLNEKILRLSTADFLRELPQRFTNSDVQRSTQRMIAV